jgi:methionine-rich copper-binding protein CopC
MNVPRFRRSWLLAGVPVVVGLSAAAPLSGARHNRLVKAEPGVDSTVAASPKQVRLWFKEVPELAVSSIKLADAAARPYATGSVTATSDKTSIAVAVTVPLPAGKYTVTWKTAGVDGHVIRGSFGFTVVR